MPISSKSWIFFVMQHFENKLFPGHLGETKSILRAKKYLYWPSMDQEIKEYIRDCEIYMKYAPKQRQYPLLFSNTLCIL